MMGGILENNSPFTDPVCEEKPGKRNKRLMTIALVHHG